MWTLVLVIVLSNPVTGQQQMNTVVVPGATSPGGFSTKSQCESAGDGHVANLANANTTVVRSCSKQQ